MKLEELEEKHVLILGFGREGRDTLLFLRKKFPRKNIGIADQQYDIFDGRQKYITLYLGKNYLKAIIKYDIVIKSPGIPMQKIAPFLKKGQKVTSQTEIFFEECPGTIIGITGTKGKSTTASLIYAVLKRGGIKAHLVGNIETPVLQFLDKAGKSDVFVYELSSFQLEDLQQSPHIAVLLNLYDEHLNHHGSFAAYAKAKANITLHQSATDFLLYNTDDKEIVKIARKSKAQKIPFKKEKVSKNAAFLAAKKPAVLVGKLFSISTSKIQKAIKEFQPLSHRLERVGTFKGVAFVNDSLATIPESTIGALDTLGKQVTTLIAGGHDRGARMSQLARRIENSKIRTLILFPTTGEKILKDLKKKPVRVFLVENMKDAVLLGFKHTKKGETCLLSPAASSFNLFKDYRDRGEQFKKFVQQYGK